MERQVLSAEFLRKQIFGFGFSNKFGEIIRLFDLNKIFMYFGVTLLLYWFS